jgi:L-amino acid N-acyltransferase YncA
VVTWVVLHAVPYIRKSLRLENTPRKPTVRNAWFQQRNTEQVLWWFGHQYRGTAFCCFHYYRSWPNYCEGIRGQVGW